MKTKKEYFEILKNSTDNADIIDFCNHEIEKIERREAQTQLDALSKLVKSHLDIETVKALKADLINFATNNFSNI